MRARRVIPLLVPAAALAVTAAIPRENVDGWRFAWKVNVTESSDPRAAQSVQPSMAVQMIPGKMRMEFTDRAQPGMPAKAWFLMDAEAGTLAMVNADDKTVMMMDPGGLGAMAGAVGGLVKMEVTDPKFSLEDLGAGEKILGRATHKYRMTRSYGMTVSVFGKKMRTTHQSVIDAWMNRDLMVDKSWEAWADRFSRGAQRVGGDAAKKLMDAERDYPRGVPMRQVVKSTDTDDKGKVTSSTTTMEMTDLKQGGLDAALFEIPADYKVMDMKAVAAETEKAMEQGRKDCEKEHGKGSPKCDPAELNLDSLVVAARQGAMQGLKDGVKEAAKEGARDAVKKGILGRLKKPGGA